jgi:hypothetical protein
MIRRCRENTPVALHTGDNLSPLEGDHQKMKKKPAKQMYAKKFTAYKSCRDQY